MRIIQIFNQYLLPGGEQSSVERIANHLEAGGHKVYRFWRSSEEWAACSKVELIFNSLKIGNNKTVLRDLEELQQKVQADVWITHNVVPVVSLGVYPLASKLNVPIVQWLHNYRPLSVSGSLSVRGNHIYLREIFTKSWRNSFFLTLLLAAHYSFARLTRKFDAVTLWVAVSKSMEQTFRSHQWYGNKLTYLHHSWDVGEVFKKNPSEDYFLFIGRIIEEKGIRFIVQLFNEPALSNCKLVIAGTGVLEQELRSIAGRNIHWAGFVAGDAKKQLIRNSKAILFPSIWEEPLSTIAYEAYEQERCVICSDRGGMREIVFDRVTGVLLPAADRESWLGTLTRVAPQELEAWGKQGRSWLETEVSESAWNQNFNTALSKYKVLNQA